MKRAAIDWKAVHGRLEASQRALEEALVPNARRVQAAYRERAIRLAKVELNPKPATPGMPALVFRLGEERYAIDMKELAEVLPFAGCVAVPGASREFSGVINLRGELRAVLDLANLLGLSASGNGFVLMVRRPGRQIGLKVDRIDELREIRADQVLAGPHGSYGKGLVSGTLVLLNVDAVLDAAFSKEESVCN